MWTRISKSVYGNSRDVNRRRVCNYWRKKSGKVHLGVLKELKMGGSMVNLIQDFEKHSHVKRLSQYGKRTVNSCFANDMQFCYISVIACFVVVCRRNPDARWFVI